ncbi:hypothetical protein Bca52824_072131 [Brassica carinata]|uniref:Uncharacterized protein n=1 Tax=Brassica carinata TaxID=52824 RepID=A0A8X7U3Z2_BRACI|nr:hypothetical protein Bca52824_072131 [Brassica carinata]
MAQQGIDGILFWPDYTLMFITSESERTTVRVGRNLRERGVFRRRERAGLVERRLRAGRKGDRRLREISQVESTIMLITC